MTYLKHYSQSMKSLNQKNRSLSLIKCMLYCKISKISLSDNLSLNKRSIFIIGGTDRALDREESGVAFGTALQDTRTTKEGEMVLISLYNVDKALKEITHKIG
jgi:hypothetical protein